MIFDCLTPKPTQLKRYGKNVRELIDTQIRICLSSWGKVHYIACLFILFLSESSFHTRPLQNVARSFLATENENFWRTEFLQETHKQKAGERGETGKMFLKMRYGALPSVLKVASGWWRWLVLVEPIHSLTFLSPLLSLRYNWTRWIFYMENGSLIIVPNVQWEEDGGDLN